jgi:hypothetical protein
VTALEVLAAHRLDYVGSRCTCRLWDYQHRADQSTYPPLEFAHAQHVLDVLAAERIATVQRPNPKEPTPALIEAAYVVQDDLSRPPEQWAIDAAAEVVGAYIDGQDHDRVHVLGHDANVSAARCSEGGKA